MNNFLPALRVATVLSCVHRCYPDALPLFAEVVLTTHRGLLTHLLNTEPDWPWQKPTAKPLLSESITSRE